MDEIMRLNAENHALARDIRKLAHALAESQEEVATLQTQLKEMEERALDAESIVEDCESLGLKIPSSLTELMELEAKLS